MPNTFRVDSGDRFISELHKTPKNLPFIYMDNVSGYHFPSKNSYEVKSPIDGRVLSLHPGFIDDFSRQMNSIDSNIRYLKEQQRTWRIIPAPKRGELVKIIGTLVEKYQHDLAELITVESGKPIKESLGEVREWIDICDFAVGLSRQLYGLTIATERVEHRMMEQWHPLGLVGVISAFNFPVAVWAWNAMLALVCGNTVVWKPSEKTPLCAVVCQEIVMRAFAEFKTRYEIPLTHISAVVLGGREVGNHIAESRSIDLVSATGSTVMGIEVAKTVAARMGKTLLELGGNNAMIITKNADLELALRAVAFSAIGTTGQRCTSLRRLFLHKRLKNTNFVDKLKAAFSNVKIGNPSNSDNLIGPLIGQSSFEKMQWALSEIKKNNQGTVFGGERCFPEDVLTDLGYYVKPAIVEINENLREQPFVMKEETFAPILYIMYYETLEEAIELNNDSIHGLSSSIFTTDMREAEAFLSSRGSDCGIANVNIGTSGAEIGGAFGGEKYTGGGRESGSDSWKGYMRRQTNTINYGDSLPLAQGIEFNL